MTKRAWIYVTGWILAGVVLGVWAFFETPQTALPMPTFLVFLFLATIAQLLQVAVPKHQFYHLNTIAFFASALLLPPFWYVSIIVFSFSVQWARERLIGSPKLRNWYIQPFNMSNHIIAGLVSARLAVTLASINLPLLSSTAVVAALASALVYVLINHFSVGVALVLARGVSWRESGILEFENLLTDYIGLCMGFVLSVVWRFDPWLMLPVLAPLILTYRALAIPRLKNEAQTDGKTGLLNPHYFNKLFIPEIDRAANMNQPLSVIMADLDLLRNINNSYGHLAGDAVLVSVAKTIREQIRKYDLACRFGGEEFCVALPGTSLGEARIIAERMRQAIASTGIKLHEQSPVINVTMSIGVACFPQDASTPNELIHQADVAVYQAKLQGRNCVVCSVDVPHSVKLKMPGVENRLESAYTSLYHPKTVPLQVVAEQRNYSSGQAGSAIKPVPATSPAQPILGWLIGAVVAVALLVSVGSFYFQPAPDPLIVLLLMIMAGITQLPQLKNLYGNTSISVSVAINFAAAVLVGIPGVVFTSATIVVAHRIFRWRAKKEWWPVIYKTTYNWATHVLAALAPVFACSLLPSHSEVLGLITSIGIMFLAALAYFLIETWLLVAAISAEKSISPLATWREECSWLVTYYVVLCLIGYSLSVAYEFQGNVGILVFTIPVLMMYYSQKEYIDRTEKGVRELKRMNQELTGANSQVLEANVAIREMNEELLVTFSKMIDARDPYVSGHSAQVANYATAIASELGLPEEHIAQVRQAAFFHDIGKIGISEQILHKPTLLNEQEYEYIKKHAAIGAQFLDTCKGLRYLVPAVKYHHERWDGMGYPDQLAGARIPLDARILAVCDAVEAMASDRPNHPAMPVDAIVVEIERCAGTQFDPQVAAAFVRVAKHRGGEFVINSARTVAQRTDLLVSSILFEDGVKVAL